MQTKADVRSVYERIADSFARTRARPWPEVLDFLDGLPARSRILDVGGGKGRHLKALVARGHHGIGVDFSRELLTIGREGIPPADVRWIEADATRLPLRDRSGGAALCVAGLPPRWHEARAVLPSLPSGRVPGNNYRFRASRRKVFLHRGEPFRPGDKPWLSRREPSRPSSGRSCPTPSTSSSRSAASHSCSS